VLLDGTLIPTRRRSGTANRRNYNGKHKKHGLLFLALTDESGNLIWISSARRSAASEITAARHDHLAGHLRTAGLGALADLGFTGLDPDPGDPVIIAGWKSTATRKTTPPSGRPTRPCPPPAPRRARLQRPQALADPHPPPPRPRQSDDPAARPDGPHPTAHHPLTDDHDLRPAAPASPSTASPGHTSPADQPIQVGTISVRTASKALMNLASGPG
jgi:hypothetical protein